MQKRMERTKKLVYIALLIALNIVIVRFLSIQTPAIRISFGFLTTALCSMLFGPVWGGGAAFLSDFLGMVVNSKGLAYFPGFGISEALYGITFGLFLYKREKNYKNIILCVIIQAIFIDIALGTLWIYMITESPAWVIFVQRCTSCALMLPIKIFGIKYLWKYVGSNVYFSSHK